MSAPREELRRVERFEELRAGMLVVCDCGPCGRRHRTMMLRIIEDSVLWGKFWIAAVNPCLGTGYGIRPVDVQSGRVFRIIDPQQNDEAERREGRDMQRVIAVHAPKARAR